MNAPPPNCPNQQSALQVCIERLDCHLHVSAFKMDHSSASGGGSHTWGVGARRELADPGGEPFDLAITPSGCSAVEIPRCHVIEPLNQ